MSEEKSETRKRMDEWVGKMSDEQALEEFKRVKFDAFKIKYRKNFEVWFEQHGKTYPPVRWNEKIMDYIWLNREQRRNRKSF